MQRFPGWVIRDFLLVPVEKEGNSMGEPPQSETDEGVVKDKTFVWAGTEKGDSRPRSDTLSVASPEVWAASLIRKTTVDWLRTASVL